MTYFPNPLESLNNNVTQHVTVTCDTTQMRILFAGQAMQGLCAFNSNGECFSNEDIAENAVKIADLLIKELNK